MRAAFLLLIFIFSTSNYSLQNIKILPYCNSIAALKFIKEYLPESLIILEAGAFDGTETKLMKTIWPNATIHAFEPVPQIYSMLQNNVKHLNKTNIYNVALSQQTGFSLFYLSEVNGQPFGAGSLLEPKDYITLAPEIDFNGTTTVRTATLNDWAKENNIDKIDFMWLDMQGYELPMLKTENSILEKTTVVYTEAIFIEGYKNQYTYNDYLQFFTENGFVLIGRDVSHETYNGINLHETFCNCIFLNKKHPAAKNYSN
jgi:FkbM family methyltransferase